MSYSLSMHSKSLVVGGIVLLAVGCTDRRGRTSPPGDADGCSDGGAPCTSDVCRGDGCASNGGCDVDRECPGDAGCGAGGRCVASTCRADAGAADDAGGAGCRRGVCDGESGRCENARVCSSVDECLGGFVCLAGEGTEGRGRCVPRAEACGPGGCPGRERCEYDPEALTAACKPASGDCDEADDCRARRICPAGECVDPTRCERDPAEPNETLGSASSAAELGPRRPIRGRLCPADVDVYDLSMEGTRTGGRVAATVRVAPVEAREVALEVELIDGEGNVVDRVAPGAGRSFGVSHVVGAAAAGPFRVRIRQAGPIGGRGVRYDLYMSSVSADAASSCSSAESIGDAGSETTDGAPRVSRRRFCGQSAGRRAERTYAITLERPGRLRVELMPEAGADLSLEVRRACRFPESVVGCAAGAGEGGREVVERTVEAGRYVAIVRSAGTGEGGGFTLSARRVEAACTPSDETCIEGGRMRRCRPGGEGARTVACRRVCRPLFGGCRPPDGNWCSAANRLSGRRGTFDVSWEELTDAIRAPGGQCQSAVGSAVGGPDYARAATIPPGDVLTARLRPGPRADGAVYVLDSCGRGASCLASGEPGRRTLAWVRNRGGSERSVRVVARARPGDAGTGRLELRLRDAVCKPGAVSCRGPTRRVCNRLGTARRPVGRCRLGCRGGR
ncbi:MAG: hypothetical protein ABEL76_07925, partial [Bradymonadaceae bacterium]